MGDYHSDIKVIKKKMWENVWVTTFISGVLFIIAVYLTLLRKKRMDKQQKKKELAILEGNDHLIENDFTEQKLDVIN